jgi:hypothetical protein
MTDPNHIAEIVRNAIVEMLVREHEAAAARLVRQMPLVAGQVVSVEGRMRIGRATCVQS